MMSLSLYQDIIKTIQSCKLRDCQDKLERKYPSISFMTLGSLLSNYVQKMMKMNHSKHNTEENIEEYYQRYLHAVENCEQSGIILRISDEICITPVLVAKFILEAFLLEQQEKKMKEDELEQILQQGLSNEESDIIPPPSEHDKLVGSDKPVIKQLTRNDMKVEINRYLRDTSLIPDRHLAIEIYLCTVHDEHYGPLPDSIKRTIGKEYEVRLSKLLHDNGILYLEEDELRKQGYDKTPDFKLEAPIAIDGKVITWIESKATFGDEETHQNYVKDQLTSYYNRFGPGLVIYWLGYVETIQTTRHKGIFVYDHLPASITKYDPNT